MKTESSPLTRRSFLRTTTLGVALPWTLHTFFPETLLALGANSAAPGAEGASHRPLDPEIEKRVDELLRQMTIDEKALLLHPGFYGTRPITRLGIPSLKFIDGSYGVRSGRATSFCTTVNHAATWNPELIHRTGIALAEEIKSKGRNLLLGPVIIIHRIPQGGRNAESYGEDPHLTGIMVTAYIQAIQSQKIPATACFLAAKTQEYHTRNYDAHVDERTLNEIYLPAFRRAVEEGKVWAIMTPYHRINGTRAANDPYLLRDQLKGQWRFPGVVMTDWMGVLNFEASIYAGLDLDMPSGHEYTVEKLTAIYTKARARDGMVGQELWAMVGQRLLADKLDDSVRRILRLMLANGLFGEQPPAPTINVAAHRALSLQVARESLVLLKNESGLLPLDSKRIRSLAVIGPNANVCRHSIHYASRVIPAVTVTPLEGIQKKAGNNVQIRYSQGCFIEDDGNLLTGEIRTPDGKAKGFFVEFFENREFQGSPAFTTVEDSIGYLWLNNPVHPEIFLSNPVRPEEEQGDFSVRASGVWTPSQSGYYQIFANSASLSVSPVAGPAGASAPKVEPQTKVVEGHSFQYLLQGKPYAVKAEFKSQKYNDFQLRVRFYEDHALENAVKAAKDSDAAVLCLGFSELLEHEDGDRSPDLPENQIELLHAVRAVNRNVIVVLNSGSGVSIEPWGSHATAILAAGYPGQEGGTAIAEVLFGDVNPSGKLPYTCLKKWSDSPVYGHYPDGDDEIVEHVERIYVGYRWCDRPDAPKAAFPFGHGLSYTTFSYSPLTITPATSTTGEVECTLEVTNPGKRAGAEVVQLYVGDDHASVDRPVKELKGFKKVFLEPGEKSTVHFAIHPDDLKFYDVITRAWKAEPGWFTVYVGSSSQDIRQTGRFALAFLDRPEDASAISYGNQVHVPSNCKS